MNCTDRGNIYAAMFNLISILIGIFALACAIPAFIPFLGALNWIVVPIAVVGLAVGLFSSRTAGRNLNILVIVIGVIRLALGGGIF
ncbi:MAG: hypothetical protein ACTHMG_05655 [Sphingomonas sp.]